METGSVEGNLSERSNQDWHPVVNRIGIAELTILAGRDYLVLRISKPLLIVGHGR